MKVLPEKRETDFFCKYLPRYMYMIQFVPFLFVKQVQMFLC